MQRSIRKRGPYYEAHEEAESARRVVDTPQARSSSYKLSYQDPEFLLRDELRPVRLQLELLKPELIQQEQGIEYTVVILQNLNVSRDGQSWKKEIPTYAVYMSKKMTKKLSGCYMTGISRNVMLNMYISL